MRRELDRADHFVLPSRQEDRPRALVEAMARALLCFRTQPRLFTTVVLSEVAACSVLVPHLQLVGAALAWGLALAVQCLGSAAILARAIRRHRRTWALAQVPDVPDGEATAASP